MGNYTAAYLAATDLARGADTDRLLELLREAYEELYDLRDETEEAVNDKDEAEGESQSLQEELDSSKEEKDKAIEDRDRYKRLADAIENQDTDRLWRELRSEIQTGKEAETRLERDIERVTHTAKSYRDEVDRLHSDINVVREQLRALHVPDDTLNAAMHWQKLHAHEAAKVNRALQILYAVVAAPLSGRGVKTQWERLKDNARQAVASLRTPLVMHGEEGAK